MAEDDRSYRRSVRNTLVVLAVLVLTIAAAIIIPPIVSPVHEQFNLLSSVVSPYGLTLSLRLNSTQFAPQGGLSITAWINSSSGQISNLSASDLWPPGLTGLWIRPCTNGWPLGVGVMAGYYTADNYSLGTLIGIPGPTGACTASAPAPGFFLLQPEGSTSIVRFNETLAQWNLITTLGLPGPELGSHPGGAYTALAADEWGDVVVAHFRVTS